MPGKRSSRRTNVLVKGVASFAAGKYSNSTALVNKTSPLPHSVSEYGDYFRVLLDLLGKVLTTSVDLHRVGMSFVFHFVVRLNLNKMP